MLFLFSTPRGTSKAAPVVCFLPGCLDCRPCSLRPWNCTCSCCGYRMCAIPCSGRSPTAESGNTMLRRRPIWWFHAPNRLVGGIRTGRQHHHEAPPTHLPHGANPQSMSPAASIGSRSQHTPHPHGNKHVVEEEVHWQRERQQLRLREVLYSGLRWWPAAVALGNDLLFVNSRPGRKGRNVRLNRTHGHSVRHRT